MNTTGKAPERLWMGGNTSWEQMHMAKRPPKGGVAVLYIREDVAAEAMMATPARADAGKALADAVQAYLAPHDREETARRRAAMAAALLAFREAGA